jgi:hypothetical protein
VGALCIVALGTLSGTAGLFASLLLADAEQVAMVTLSVSFLSLTAGLGSVLAWQAWQSIQGQQSPPFQPRRVGILGVLFLVTVIFLGHAVLGREMLTLFAFPPSHVAAAVLPALIVLAFVGQALGRVTRRRDMVLQLGSGAFLSTALAFTLELLAILGLLVLAIVAVTAQPGGLERIQDLATTLQDPTWLQDPAQLAPLIRSPFVLVPALLVFAVLIPIIEEAVKTVGVGLMGHRRPTLAQAFLWGLAGGAGFALTEALFNSVAGLDSWASIISLRIGATLLHCFTGALMGLAWYAILAQRRWGRALGFYGASVGFHGLWNALAAGMAVATMGLSEVEPGDFAPLGNGSAKATLLLLILILATVAALGLTGLTWHVREQSRAGDDPEDQSGTPSTEAASAAGAVTADSPGEMP